MYLIRNARLYLRPMGAAAVDFKIGKQTKLFPDWMPGIVELELEIGNSADDGRVVVGIAGDWPAFGWLDKRSHLPERQRLALLLDRLSEIRDRIVGFQFADMDHAWKNLHEDEHASLGSEFSKSESQWGNPHDVQLCETFCLAMFERAILDGICRWCDQPFAQWAEQNGLVSSMPDSRAGSQKARPLESIAVRHTVGLADPIRPVGQGSSEGNSRQDNSLQTVLERDGVRFFKIKVSGQTDQDINRLQSIWELIQHVRPTITIDGNESFRSAKELLEFVNRLERTIPDMFACVRFVEQPLDRHDTFSTAQANGIRSVAERIPLVIDEADSSNDAFQRAMELGYTGVSHKNCKGIIKSFRNRTWIQSQSKTGYFLTGEDLTNVPLTPLHQDLTVASVLGLQDVERNGHHYFPGLLHFPDSFVQRMLEDYPRLYEPCDLAGRQTARLRINDGQLDIRDLHRYSGLGIKTVPPDQNRIDLCRYVASE